MPLQEGNPDLCTRENNLIMKETKIALGTWAWGAGIDTRGDWEHTME